ncbi:glycosyl transferase [Pseudaminobacter sp. 19-2017]|uniref:Glycosyl transferase n=1 Tax=Pseudaminobacter soli (ex Zhang et al. 2022) TaxID=2831468 RepID=A0A942I6H6_9HYPH|nr:glycosyl transferase [Pseudaminobacter soli]MBS3647315.1 glycosyl transferase [Pseudaminobacter soli]
MGSSVHNSRKAEDVENRRSPGDTDSSSTAALLSNGRYSVLVTSAGAGYSTWQDLDVIRWREDRTRDCWGQFFYIRDLADNKLWSLGKQPLFVAECAYEHAFHGDRAELSCRTEDIETSCAICVAPDVDAEVRMVTVTNHGSRVRHLELTSYSEVCLNNRRADRAHPAFAKLFVETAFDEGTGALLARRRPRAAEEKPLWAIHVSSSTLKGGASIEFETDRLKFLGRGRTIENPAAFETKAGLSGSTGPVLDPIFSLRRTLELGPGATERVAFITGAANTQAGARSISTRFADIEAASATFSDALQSHRMELRRLGLSPSDVRQFNRLAEGIVFGDPALRDPAAVKRTSLARDGLWAHSISGDIPIVLLRLAGDGDASLLREALSAHDFLGHRRLQFDLVMLDEGHTNSAENWLRELRAGPKAELLGKSGGIFVVSADAIQAVHTDTIAAAARIVLSDRRGSLADQLARPSYDAPRSQRQVTSSATRKPPRPSATTENTASYWNGFGAFSADGHEYVIRVDATTPGKPELPPAPWSNVIANPNFGCLTSEAGLGYTWSGNSQMNRLTPWSNDPVSDAPGEVLYLRDEDTGEVWTPTPLPTGNGSVVNVHHGQGYSRYEGASHDLHHDLLVFVPPADAIKILRLKLTSSDTRPRRLSATYYAEWVLGTQREDAVMQVVCERDIQSGAIMARNPWATGFPGLAFAAASQPVRSSTSDRSEFLGFLGSASRPAGLQRLSFSGRHRALHDPCAAITVDASLAPGESTEIVFVLGQAGSLPEVRRLVREYARMEQSQAKLAETCGQWDGILNCIQVVTPDVGFNLMMNRWLLYQVLACRVWARSAFYQSGGAYGFRDQLQDVMALVHCAPHEARSHILRAAARQFEEGDVQHWWHPPLGVGVRTRMTDDLYFLPYVVHHYVSATGDVGLLDEQVAFISSPVLKQDQEEDFNRPDVSGQIGTVYDHCIRALERGLRLGSHGLPLMGTGDWNDGMNKVGAAGKGESVWNGWFFVTVLNAFAAISSSRGDEERSAWCRNRAEELRAALEENAWDGAWYRRAYFDDGTPLGSCTGEECQIDAIPQAWAVISGVADSKRTSAAMHAVYERLVRTEEKLIQLFDPPFDKGRLQPGYIKGYVPGIRENGGQYTHAAAWVVLATALQGDGDRALKLWNLINPINHATTHEQASHYMVEPYVVSADIYGAPPHTGRGGWTWYTGSAAWLYRVGLENILGFRRQGGTLQIDPCIPRNWPGFELSYVHGSSTYRIRVDNEAGAGKGVVRTLLDGRSISDRKVPLSDDGHSHDVLVTIG